jgi:hypothetical protein
MYATQEGHDVGVSKLNRYYGLNHPRYLTTCIPQGGMARPSIDRFEFRAFREVMGYDLRRAAAAIEIPNRWTRSHAGTFSHAHRVEAGAPYQMVLGGGKPVPDHAKA